MRTNITEMNCVLSPYHYDGDMAIQNSNLGHQ